MKSLGIRFIYLIKPVAVYIKKVPPAWMGLSLLFSLNFISRITNRGI
jgi:hypothetical protein